MSGFGFSIGDIVKGIEVVILISETLSAANIAGVEFQALRNDLETFLQILTIVKKIEPDDVQDTVSLKKVIKLCRTSVAEIDLQRQRYSRYLGRNAPTSIIAIAFMKIKWTLFTRSDIEKLRQNLQNRNQNLQTLLGAIMLKESKQQAAGNTQKFNLLATTAQEQSNQLISNARAAEEYVRYPPMQTSHTIDNGRMFSVVASIENDLKDNEQAIRELHTTMTQLNRVTNSLPQSVNERVVRIINPDGSPSPIPVDFVPSAEAFRCMLVHNAGLENLDSQFNVRCWFRFCRRGVMPDFENAYDYGRGSSLLTYLNVSTLANFDIYVTYDVVMQAIPAKYILGLVPEYCTEAVRSIRAVRGEVRITTSVLWDKFDVRFSVSLIGLPWQGWETPEGQSNAVVPWKGPHPMLVEASRQFFHKILSNWRHFGFKEQDAMLHGNFSVYTDRGGGLNFKLNDPSAAVKEFSANGGVRKAINYYSC